MVSAEQEGGRVLPTQTIHTAGPGQSSCSIVTWIDFTGPLTGWQQGLFHRTLVCRIGFRLRDGRQEKEKGGACNKPIWRVRSRRQDPEQANAGRSLRTR